MHKLASVKLWMTIICLVFLGFIIFTNATEFNNVAMLLVAVPLGYTAANVAQKKIISGGCDAKTSKSDR